MKMKLAVAIGLAIAALAAAPTHAAPGDGFFAGITLAKGPVPIPNTPTRVGMMVAGVDTPLAKIVTHEPCENFYARTSVTAKGNVPLALATFCSGGGSTN